MVGVAAPHLARGGGAYLARCGCQPFRGGGGCRILNARLNTSRVFEGHTPTHTPTRLPQLTHTGSPSYSSSTGHTTPTPMQKDGLLMCTHPDTNTHALMCKDGGAVEQLQEVFNIFSL